MRDYYLRQLGERAGQILRISQAIQQLFLERDQAQQRLVEEIQVARQLCDPDALYLSLYWMLAGDADSVVLKLDELRRLLGFTAGNQPPSPEPLRTAVPCPDCRAPLWARNRTELKSLLNRGPSVVLCRACGEPWRAAAWVTENKAKNKDGG